MGKCLYCSKKMVNNDTKNKNSFNQDNIEKNISEKLFYDKKYYFCCDKHCIGKSKEYLIKLQEKRIFLYAIIFIASISMILTVLFQYSMIIIYYLEIICALAFIIFPYPITNFEVLVDNGIKKVLLYSRGVGFIILLVGIIMVIFA